LYDDGREDLDEDRYDQAESKFKQLADMNGPQTDAALYWKAYAQNRMGKRDSALSTIADLKRRFPQSRWQKMPAPWKSKRANPRETPHIRIIRAIAI